MALINNRDKGTDKWCVKIIGIICYANFRVQELVKCSCVLTTLIFHTAFLRALTTSPVHVVVRRFYSAWVISSRPENGNIWECCCILQLKGSCVHAKKPIRTL